MRVRLKHGADNDDDDDDDDGRTVLRSADGRLIPRNTWYVLPSVCLTVIKGNVGPWWRYALY